MNRRPLSVTLIAWLFIVASGVGFIYHLREFATHPPLETAVICLIRLIAVVAGIFMLRGCNWARWLLSVWIAFHVGVSAFHTVFEVTVHAVLFVVVVYFLFRPRSTAWFRPERSSEASPSGSGKG